MYEATQSYIDKWKAEHSDHTQEEQHRSVSVCTIKYYKCSCGDVFVLSCVEMP